MSFLTVYGWLAIGLAASLAAMILPFRRGVAGVAINTLSGVGGALVVPLLSYLVIPAREPDTPLRLAFAAVGALVALGLVHLAYGRLEHRQLAHRYGGEPQPRDPRI